MEFGQHLTSLIGNEINILFSDGNSIEGVLAAIKSDYFIIETDNYIIYHNIKNIKGFSKSTKNSKNQKNSKKSKTRTITDYSSEGMTLREVLEDLQSKWVSIDIQSNQNNNQGNNKNNNQGYSGFLAEIEDDYVILIGKDVQVYLNISQINNIVKANESNMQSNNNNQNSNDNYDSGSIMEFESIFGGSRR